MTCNYCQTKSICLFNFNCRQCLVRWLRMAMREHAKSYLDQYRIRHGESAMLELIAEVKNDPR